MTDDFHDLTEEPSDDPVRKALAELNEVAHATLQTVQEEGGAWDINVGILLAVVTTTDHLYEDSKYVGEE